MLGAEGEPKKRRYWYALIRDANDGELRVIYRCKLNMYRGIPGVPSSPPEPPSWVGLYNGSWSVVMESQDQDHLRAFGRLSAPETRWPGPKSSKLESYFSYLEGREPAEED